MNACQLWRVVGNCTMWECPNRPWTCCIFFVQNTLWCTANECLDFWFGFYIYLFLYPSSCSWFHLKYISLSNKCEKIKIYCDENLAWCIFLSDNPAENPNLRSVIRNAHNFARKNLFFITTVVENVMLLLPPDNTWCTDLKTTKQMDKWRNTKTVGTALGSKDCNRECHTYVHSVCFIQLRHCRMSFIVDQSAAMKCPENVFFLFFFVIYVTLFICLMNESARELNSVIISDEWIIILLHAIRVCINNCRLVLIDFFFLLLWWLVMLNDHISPYHASLIDDSHSEFHEQFESGDFSIGIYMNNKFCMGILEHSFVCYWCCMMVFCWFFMGTSTVSLWMDFVHFTDKINASFENFVENMANLVQNHK